MRQMLKMLFSSMTEAGKRCIYAWRTQRMIKALRIT